MALTPFDGPVLTFGISNTGSSIPSGGYNGQRGPSLFDLGDGIADPRPFYNYVPGANVTKDVYGFPMQGAYVSAAPSVASTNGIAATQSATGNGSLTLSGSGAGVTTGVSITSPETGETVTGLLALDGAASGVAFGSDATVNIWSPATLVARTISITSSVNDSGGAYTVNGRDVYGYKMTETITGPNATTVFGQKAFKYIASITSCGTIASTGVYVGYSNVFGFPWRVMVPGHVTIWAGTNSSASLVTVSSGITFGSTRATQTSTTPDVRGTWNSTLAGGSAPNGSTWFLYMGVTASPSGLASITSTDFSGLFGAAQYTGY